MRLYAYVAIRRNNMNTLYVVILHIIYISNVSFEYAILFKEAKIIPLAEVPEEPSISEIVKINWRCLIFQP